MDTVGRMRTTDKIKLVNLILASIKDTRGETTGRETPMPVYEGLTVFAEIHQQRKGVSYAPNGKFLNGDFKHMRELLIKIGDRLAEGGTNPPGPLSKGEANPPGPLSKGELVTDKMRIDNLRAFLEAVCKMKNQWYFENRFTPYGLNHDFENIYTQLKNNSDYGRRKAAFDYL